MYCSVPTMSPASVWLRVNVAAVSLPIAARKRANPKSSSLVPSGCDHHVGRLQVAMHDALRVRSVKSLRNFDTDAKSLSKRQGSSPQARRQGFPLQVLHHEEIHTVVVSDVIERANARMRESSDGAGFVSEACPASRVGGRRQRKSFIATCRSSRVSRALYTSPMPPAPMKLSMRKTPSCIPAERPGKAGGESTTVAAAGRRPRERKPSAPLSATSSVLTSARSSASSPHWRVRNASRSD